MKVTQKSHCFTGNEAVNLIRYNGMAKYFAEGWLVKFMFISAKDDKYVFVVWERPY